MISLPKLATMLKLQDQLNCAINPNWLTADYAWHRAIMVEAVEALEHYGWKWWKRHSPDFGQVNMELVDIWHFAMSMYLVKTAGHQDMAARMFLRDFTESPLFDLATAPSRSKLDVLIAAAGSGQFHTDAFAGLMADFDLSWDELYTTYIAKNVLNIFRQDHGYKNGSYRKEWDGMEDNVRLEQLMGLDPIATPEELYARLETLYRLVTP